MLQELALWNVGGIERAEIPFGPGLTVITGESGAGKSSVVRALELVSGKRASAGAMRVGADEAGAEARFTLGHPLLGLEDLPCAPGEALILRREISRAGRSRASIQGSHAPLASYAALSGRLLHIQSQFAQMDLLDASRQLAMIDSCAPPSIQETAVALRRAFDDARDGDAELRSMARRREEIERLYANAEEVLSLVRRVEPRPGLEASLGAELSELSRRIAHRERARMALDRLTGGLSEQGLFAATRNALDTIVDVLSDDDRREAHASIEDGLRLLEDAVGAAEAILDGEGDDLRERERVEARLGALRRLRRLSGTGDEEELLAWCRQAEEELGWLEGSFRRFEDLSRELLVLKRRANALAMELRRGRRETARGLERTANAHLAEMGMEGTTLEVQFTELDRLRRTGADEVALALRSGGRAGRVDKMASGGELSRILLALRLSSPDDRQPSTLVFDEVEAGLGGRAAVLAGLKLKELSARCQVILVTHEASIAALGDRHVLIQRVGDVSRIRPIEGEERVREIARMLSGSPDMEEAQEHARSLLARRHGGERTEA